MQFLARGLTRWWFALPVVAVLGLAILIPGLGSFGLWEPQERTLADRVAPRIGTEKPEAAAPVANAGPSGETCLRSPPKDALARSLPPRAMVLGRDHMSDSDAGRRMPFALLAVLLALATAGIVMRTIGARAGVIAGVILLSMPLCVLQARQLTNEIGTAAAGALAIYGLLALQSLEEVLFGALVPRALLRTEPVVQIIPASLEAIVGALALAAGLVLGFISGGALLGIAVPVGAFAAAGALGVPTILDLGRAGYNAGFAIAARVRPRWAIGRRPLAYRRGDNAPALLATALAAIAVTAIVYQVFSLHEPQPGLIPPQRALFGHAIVANNCWSPALGGVWRADDDLRYIFDSTFEQIAYGTFPWGILAPIAFAALLASPDPKQRKLGGITLAWASASWIASELFQRKVGFSLYAGFPAFAAAIGGWIEGLLTTRPEDEPDRGRRGMRLLLGVFVAIAVLDLGKDLESFTEKLSSILIGGDAIAYPTASRLMFLPTRLWVLAIGMLVALALALALVFAGSRTGWQRMTARIAPVVAAAATIVLGAFWAFGWQPALASNLSSKALFDTIESLRKPGDAVVIMGDLGDAPHDYAPRLKPETMASREVLVAALARPARVFAIAPATELCQLHHEIGGKPYFVIDDRNVKSTLLSNKIDGTTDKNPLGKMILRTEPPKITTKPKAKIVFDNRVQLLGWDIPAHVHTGEKFEVRMYYKILQPVGGAWQILFHFTGPTYFNGDHQPIDNKCPTSTWQPGDFIVDTHTVQASGGGYARGAYEVWTGFFTGSNPNFKNMTVSEAPGDMRDKDDRVKITTITLD